MAQRLPPRIEEAMVEYLSSGRSPGVLGLLSGFQRTFVEKAAAAGGFDGEAEWRLFEGVPLVASVLARRQQVWDRGGWREWDGMPSRATFPSAVVGILQDKGVWYGPEFSSLDAAWQPLRPKLTPPLLCSAKRGAPHPDMVDFRKEVEEVAIALAGKVCVNGFLGEYDKAHWLERCSVLLTGPVLSAVRPPSIPPPTACEKASEEADTCVYAILGPYFRRLLRPGRVWHKIKTLGELQALICQYCMSRVAHLVERLERPLAVERVERLVDQKPWGVPYARGCFSDADPPHSLLARAMIFVMLQHYRAWGNLERFEYSKCVQQLRDNYFERVVEGRYVFFSAFKHHLARNGGWGAFMPRVPRWRSFEMNLEPATMGEMKLQVWGDGVAMSPPLASYGLYFALGTRGLERGPKGSLLARNDGEPAGPRYTRVELSCDGIQVQEYAGAEAREEAHTDNASSAFGVFGPHYIQSYGPAAQVWELPCEGVGELGDGPIDLLLICVGAQWEGVVKDERGEVAGPRRGLTFLLFGAGRAVRGRPCIFSVASDTKNSAAVASLVAYMTNAVFKDSAGPVGGLESVLVGRAKTGAGCRQQFLRPCFVPYFRGGYRERHCQAVCNLLSHCPLSDRALGQGEAENLASGTALVVGADHFCPATLQSAAPTSAPHDLQQMWLASVHSATGGGDGQVNLLLARHLLGLQ
jgi:hypothetical protein